MAYQRDMASARATWMGAQEARVFLSRVANGQSSRQKAWSLAEQALWQCSGGKLEGEALSVQREKGKPNLTRECLELAGCDLRFSVSHARSMVACAVAVGREVGVDVEPLNRGFRRSMQALSKRWLSELEAEMVAKEPGTFLPFWVAKEAAAKATGLGLGGLSPRSYTVWQGEQLATELDLGESGVFGLDVVLGPDKEHVAALCWEGKYQEVRVFWNDGFSPVELPRPLSLSPHPPPL